MNKFLRKMTVKAKVGMRNLFHKENGEVNIVAIVILIGIAVILALIFKDAIANLLSSLFSSIETNANNAITPT